MCFFQRKTGHIWETVKDTAKVLLITKRKCYTPCQIRSKESGIRSSRLNENHRPWMTLKVTENQCGRLF